MNLTDCHILSFHITISPNVLLSPEEIYEGCIVFHLASWLGRVSITFINAMTIDHLMRGFSIPQLPDRFPTLPTYYTYA